jgi:hypothetical protein
MLFNQIYTIFIVIIAILIVYKSKFFSDDYINKNLVISAFVLKLLSFIGFYYIYTFYYTDRNTADMYKYFDDANWLYKCILESPLAFIQVITRENMNSTALFYNDKVMHWFISSDLALENNHRFIIIVNLLCRFFSRGDILIHGVVFNLLSFTGLWSIYKAVNTFIQKPKPLIFLPIMFMPSILFWGSGLLKESIVLFLMGVSFYCFVKFTQHKKLSLLITSLLFVFLLFFIKIYIAIALLLVFLLLFIIDFILYKRVIMISFINVLVITLALIFIGNIDYIQHDIDTKIQNSIKLTNSVVVKSNYNIYDATSTDLNIFKVLPNALIVSFLRPFPWEISNPFMIVSFLENYFIIILLMLSIYLLFRNKDIIDNRTIAIIIAFTIFILFTYVLSGLIAMNFGTLMRYKIPALIFLSIFPFLIFSTKISKKIEYYLK